MRNSPYPAGELTRRIFANRVAVANRPDSQRLILDIALQAGSGKMQDHSRQLFDTGEHGNEIAHSVHHEIDTRAWPAYAADPG